MAPLVLSLAHHSQEEKVFKGADVASGVVVLDEAVVVVVGGALWRIVVVEALILPAVDDVVVVLIDVVQLELVRCYISGKKTIALTTTAVGVVVVVQVAAADGVVERNFVPSASAIVTWLPK